MTAAIDVGTRVKSPCESLGELNLALASSSLVNFPEQGHRQLVQIVMRHCEVDSNSKSEKLNNRM